MTAQRIDGIALSHKLRADVSSRAAALKAKGITPGLAVILVFIGTKMCLIDFYKIPVLVSLGVVVGILAITMLLSVRTAKPQSD